MKTILSKICLILAITAIIAQAIPASACNEQPEERVSATLNLGYNDGIQCFLNDSLIINALEEWHPSHYWDRSINVGEHLQVGENVLTCRVSNGDGNPGWGGGNFDAELVLNGKNIITRGDISNKIETALWRFYAKSGKGYVPPKDANGNNWYDSKFNEESWNYGYAPFGAGDNKPSCTPGVLKAAPDNAWFRKRFFLNAEQLGLAKPKQQVNLFLGAYAAPTIVSVAENRDIEQQSGKVYYTKYSTPIFTGISQYGSDVKIYIDDNFAGYAQVQQGEKSGTANFFYWHKVYLPTGRHTVYVVAENPVSKFVSAPSIKAAFEVTAIKEPTILGLGENKKVDMTRVYITRQSAPLITGVSPYGKEVKIYIDKKYFGKAIAQDGQKSGVSNFSVMPRLSLGRHELVATTYDPTLNLESISRQVITFEVR